jgi:hypothetical protein
MDGIPNPVAIKNLAVLQQGFLFIVETGHCPVS